MDKKLKIVFVGAGWVCATRHIPSFAKRKDVELFGVIDANPEKAKKLALKWKMPHFSTESDVAKINWFKDVDAVVVTSPPMTHYDWIKQSLMTGKHVLTEKPFSTQREHGQELLALAKEKNLQLCVVHNTLFSNAQQKARKWIAEGKIGEVTGLSITLLNNPNRHLPAWYDDLPFGLLYDEISHFLYTSESLSKNLQVQSAEVYKSRSGLKRTPSKAKVSLLSDNFPVFFTLDFESPVCEWHIMIEGTKGMIDIDNFRDIFIFIPNDGQHKAKDHLKTISHVVRNLIAGFVKTGWANSTGNFFHGMDKVVEEFVNAVNGNSFNSYISGDFGIKVFHLLWDVIDKLEANQVNKDFALQLPKPKLGTQ